MKRKTDSRERQHCPGREEFFKLIAILPRQTLGEVLARIGRTAKRGCTYTDAGMAAAQLLLPKIHEIEARCDPDPLRAQDRQQTMVMVAPGHLPRFIGCKEDRGQEANIDRVVIFGQGDRGQEANLDSVVTLAWWRHHRRWYHWRQR